MSISVQAWMDRLRQRVQEGSIVFNPVSDSSFIRRLYMNQPPPDDPVRMEARRQPIPLTDQDVEESRRIGERHAHQAARRAGAATSLRMRNRAEAYELLLLAFPGRIASDYLALMQCALDVGLLDSELDRVADVIDTQFSMYRPFSDGSRTPYVPFTPLPTCAQCGKTGLKQTYTSTRDQREICADCFEGLQDKGLAREQGQPLKKKARHPLDAWMEE